MSCRSGRRPPGCGDESESVAVGPLALPAPPHGLSSASMYPHVFFVS